LGTRITCQRWSYALRFCNQTVDAGSEYGLDIRRELKIAIEKTNTFVEQHRRSFRWHKSTVLKSEQQSAAILRQLVQDLEALKMKELMPSRCGTTLPEPATRGVKVGSHSNERRQSEIVKTECARIARARNFYTIFE
jgi:hypothetical protein